MPSATDAHAQGQTLSFDSASAAVKNSQTGAVERVDLPMRASAGGYYANLMQMYNHLGVPLHPIRFLFVFAEALGVKPKPPSAKGAGARNAYQTATDSVAGPLQSYFIHASNLHQTPPPWPRGRSVVAHLLELVYVVVCYIWLTVACFVVAPITTSVQGSDNPGGENFSQYLDRIWLPRRYVSRYLLPLMSSVSTCTHSELLNFPASDLVYYKRLSHREQHYAVCGGVGQVQAMLTRDIHDVRLGCQVSEIVPRANGEGVLVRWARTNEDLGRESSETEEVFDRVILAVSPDVAGKVFRPLAGLSDKIPTVQVESSVLAPATSGKNDRDIFSVVDAGNDTAATGCMHHGPDPARAQTITLRSKLTGKGPRTEALHEMPSGVVVSTCPMEAHGPSVKTLRYAKFTRTLRTPESRAVVERLMGRRGYHDEVDEKDHERWVSGDDNVWLAGAWCWDGMVLLEGCVVSAMQVADDFGVDIPWQTAGRASHISSRT